MLECTECIVAYLIIGTDWMFESTEYVSTTGWSIKVSARRVYRGSKNFFVPALNERMEERAMVSTARRIISAFGLSQF